MTTVAIVSAGFMGAGLGGALRAGGARVVVTLDGRSARTRRLAADAGLDVVPSLLEAVAAADVILSVTPPGQAVAAARAIAAARARVATAGDQQVVADLNAVSPGTMRRVAAELGDAGGGDAGVVDGSISGPPPSVEPGARVYLAGPRAAVVAELPWHGLVEPVVLGDRLGDASALKMCTGSVYKGLIALVTQAMRTAGAYGVLDRVVEDLAHNGLARTAGVAQSATKARRYVDEMREVAATQATAGLSPDLFAAVAAIYTEVAATSLADGDPETARDLSPADIVARLGK
jgi:3-hydroxyisobutyrate dehydrogenase-like beta-hydroxyacid dehydrogenase